jgi:hypothetical protein
VIELCQNGCGSSLQPDSGFVERGAGLIIQKSIVENEVNIVLRISDQCELYSREANWSPTQTLNSLAVRYSWRSSFSFMVVQSMGYLTTVK